AGPLRRRGPRGRGGTVGGGDVAEPLGEPGGGTSLTQTANFSPVEIMLGMVVAILAQLGGLVLLRTGGGSSMRADISDERARPMSVAITPVVDDAPLLKLGSKRQPGKLPDKWIAPRAVERQTPAAFPSPKAAPVPHAIPT